MEKTEIEKILNDLVVYLSPEYFEDEFKNKITPGKKFNIEVIKKYFEIIISINWFLRKVSRYEVYFSEFYPQSKNIKNHEALEHHFHAYLEDVETLRNKICYYIGSLKNDLKPIAQNKQEISKALEWLNSQVYEVFKNVSEQRGKHRHKGSRFIDSNVIDIEMAEIMLSDNSPFKNELTKEGVDFLRQKTVESFESGKMFWVETARKNLSQVVGVTNEILEKTREFLYTLLDITPLDFKK